MGVEGRDQGKPSGLGVLREGESRHHLVKQSCVRTAFALGTSWVGQLWADLFTHPQQEAEHAGNNRLDGYAHVTYLSESIVILFILFTKYPMKSSLRRVLFGSQLEGR